MPGGPGQPPPNWGTPPPAGYGQPQYGAAGGYSGSGQLAEWPQRALGGLVDFVAPIVVVGAVARINGLLGLVLDLASLVWFIYNGWLNGTTGKSIGHQVAGVKVVRAADGQVIGGGLGIDPITQDVCAFYNDHAVFNDYTGVVLDVEEGKRIAHALGEGKAAILRNHGLLTVGQSVDEAAWWFITMERSCHVQLLAEAAGKPKQIDKEMAALTQTQVGSHLAGWFSFQPLWERIVREQPDLLD